MTVYFFTALLKKHVEGKIQKLNVWLLYPRMFTSAALSCFQNQGRIIPIWIWKLDLCILVSI